MKPWMITGWMAANISVLGAAPEAGPGEAYQGLWNDPKVSRRIEEGIRANRMGDVVLRLTGAGSQPLSDAKVRIEQTRHDFLFGANIFMLGGFPTPEENRQFETMFTSLLNYATVPFYWSDLEPEPGKPRFAKDSPSIYRRPPPDAVVEFCREHGLAMKGHPLVWHQWYPKWRPDDPQDAMRRIEQRIAEIAARYGAAISHWEVVNEPMGRIKGLLKGGGGDKWCNSPDGERDQAMVARNFYRLWFSHPRIEAITWWNLVDGTAFKGEDKMNAGLLRKDFSPKPAYEALDRLINHDWKTVLETSSTADGEVAFRGFHGEYTVTAQSGGKTVKQTFRLKKGAPNEWTIRF